MVTTFIKANHRYGISILAALSSLFSPPDVFSSVYILFFLFLYYEIVVWSYLYLAKKEIDTWTLPGLILILPYLAFFIFLWIFDFNFSLSAVEFLFVVTIHIVIESCHVIFRAFHSSLREGFLSLLLPVYGAYYFFKNKKSFRPIYYWVSWALLKVLLDLVLLIYLAYLVYLFGIPGV